MELIISTSILVAQIIYKEEVKIGFKSIRGTNKRVRIQERTVRTNATKASSARFEMPSYYSRVVL